MPRAGVLLVRALRLACPNCGRGQLFHSWFRLRESCPSCGLLLQRNEDADYWTGGWMINFMIAETCVAVLIAALVWILWPDVPWNGVLYGTAGAAIVAPLLTWPVSRTLWLAIDLAFRPPEDVDFANTSGSGAR
jgi:uncharacterized protein (DUF983 family)